MVWEECYRLLMHYGLAYLDPLSLLCLRGLYKDLRRVHGAKRALVLIETLRWKDLYLHGEIVTVRCGALNIGFERAMIDALWRASQPLVAATTAYAEQPLLPLFPAAADASIAAAPLALRRALLPPTLPRPSFRLQWQDPLSPFQTWLTSKMSPSTARAYVSRVRRILKHPCADPLGEYCRRLRGRGVEHAQIAWRKYREFIDQRGGAG